MLPGLYVREVRASSFIELNSEILLCQLLNIYENRSLSLSTSVYTNGSSCADTTARLALSEFLSAELSTEVLVNQTIALSDDTRSDILGAFTLDPSADTLQRYSRCLPVLTYWCKGCS